MIFVIVFFVVSFVAFSVQVVSLLNFRSLSVFMCIMLFFMSFTLQQIWIFLSREKCYNMSLIAFS